MMNGTSSFQTMKVSSMLQRTPEWFAVIAALFLATGTAHATADGCSVVLRTPDGFLNLRTLPKMGTRIIARLKPGSIIYNDEKTENGWTHVTGIPWGNSRIRPVIGWTKSRFIVTVNCESLETAHVDWSPEYPQTQGAWH